MPNKIILPKEELYNKYITENWSQKKVAEYFKVSVDTIRQNLLDYSIPSHKPKDWMESAPIVLNAHQLEIINGALLGDGSMIIHKNGTNAYFAYLSKSKEHVEYVCQDLLDFAVEGHEIAYSEIYDNRTQRTYEQYNYRSIANSTFTEIYNKWYSSKKHIPSDLILTPTVCLIWYLGDGTLASQSTRTRGEIFLCTDSFEKNEIETILLPQLSQFSPTLSQHGNNQYRIRIPRFYTKAFFDYIGPCPVKDYQHKWAYVEYKRKPLRYEPEVEKQIIQAYEDGCSPGTIANYFKRDRSTILNCLKRYGIDTNKNKFSDKKVVIRNEE